MNNVYGCYGMKFIIPNLHSTPTGKNNETTTEKEGKLRNSFSKSLRRDAPTRRSIQSSGYSSNTPHDSASQIDCSAVPDPGSCADYRLVYHYSAISDSCRLFYYGGCAGNTNRFETIEECEKSCKKERQVIEDFSANKINNEVRTMEPEIWEEEEDVEEHVVVDSQALPELCMLPEQRGSCFDKILQWRYDNEKLQCVSFMYSGCNANANRFSSKENCERACGEYRSVDVCRRGKDVGSCHLAVPRWYYDDSSKQCRMMMWTGCGGNGNSFSSKSDCEALCNSEASWSNNDKDICKLPRSSGPCTDAISMWHFDAEANQCRQFTYGGCRGNSNRFVSKQQCEQRCQPSTGTNGVATNAEIVCQLPFEMGPCRMTSKKYFYDPFTQTCQLFSYGGCEGNANRFETELECYKMCSSIKAKPTESIAQLKYETTPVIYVVDKGPIYSGTVFRIRCNSHGVFPVTWYKNGGLLQFGSRITEENDDTLEIVDSLTSDAGVYSCVAGHDSQMSEGVEVVIKRSPTTVKTTKRMTPTTTTTTIRPPMFKAAVTTNCVDYGTAGTCQLIVRNGLCNKKRYGSFCCRTCTDLNKKKL